jgi:hypothetical protein
MDLSGQVGRVPEIVSFDVAPLSLGAVSVLHLAYEMAGDGSAEVLPPALNPSVPPHLTWLFHRAESGPFGAFTLAQTRVGARAGLKPRGFLVSAVTDNARLAEALSSGWGYAAQLGVVDVRRHYDRILASVRLGDRPILEVDLVDPEILSGGMVAYTANLQLARTPLGLRLVQVDAEHVIHKAEVGRPELHRFDAEAWGEGRLRPTAPIVGSVADAELTLPGLRYVCDPDVPAAEGTVRLPAPDVVLPAGF